MSYKITIVEDDTAISDLLKEALEKEGYIVSRAYSGTEALMLLEKEKPDLLLLDLMLPGLPGEELLPKLKGILTVIISAKTDIDNKVRLLYEGASDYITKPFVVSELLARIAALLRLSKAQKQTEAEDGNKNVISEADLELDTSLLTVSYKEESISLTRTEAAILHLLMLNSGRPLGRSTILERISEDTPDCTERSLKQHVSNIRKKLQSLDGIDHIEAIYGIGFRFVES
ncbi:MAG: response regulator transcription factor [Lachnospiraceae bacterium]|nr:response regulator transcription factor [Lachnospiraceae bacterium]